MTTPQEAEVQRQTEVLTEPTELDGALDTVRQASPETVETQSGAEQQPTERSYSQTEWDKRDRSKDKEVAELRRQLSLRDQQMQQERSETVENAARQRDAQSVDNGDITHTDAVERQRQRQAVQTREAAHQEELIVSREQSNQSNQIMRVVTADTLAKQYGITAADLLTDDQWSMSPDGMEMMAKFKGEQLKLNQDREAFEQRIADQVGNETYDSGQGGARVGGRQSYIQELESGDAIRSATDIDRITAKYGTGG